MSKQYSFRIKIFSKKNSHPLETICFYSGQDQFDVLNAKTYASNTKENVVWSSIEVPSLQSNPEMFRHLPEYLKFRSANPKKDMIANARNILWQGVGNRETREDAQLSRMFELTIPSFLTTVEASQALRKFSRILVSEGMIADCALHSRQNSLTISLLDRITSIQNGTEDKVEVANTTTTNDYQGYIICPLRAYNNGQFVNKQRNWNQTIKLEQWRKQWITIITESILNAQLPEEDIASWEEKLSIYGEYSSIKESLIHPEVPENIVNKSDELLVS